MTLRNSSRLTKPLLIFFLFDQVYHYILTPTTVLLSPPSFLRSCLVQVSTGITWFLYTKLFLLEFETKAVPTNVIRPCCQFLESSVGVPTFRL